jgi:hypothetical protein
VDKQALQPWQERVRDEQRELCEKVAKLNAFIQGEPFLALARVDKLLLLRQIIHMTAYAEVLDARISRFDLGKS